MYIRPLLASSFAMLVLAVSAHASSTFDLSGSIGSSLATATGAPQSLSISSNGITAAFSSIANNGFQVQNTSGALKFSPALLDNNFFGTDPLTITFSAPVSGQLTIPYAILDAFSLSGLPDTLTLLANTGQSAVFTGMPDGLALQEPEGTASFLLSSPTTSVTLTSPVAFAIGNVSTVTPEPSSFVLLATGLVGAAAGIRRRLS